jgi:hypothetical protein
MRKLNILSLSLLFVLLALAGGIPAASADPPFEIWRDKRGELPPFDQIVFLPIFRADEPVSFVDLGNLEVSRGGKQWKALQFTRDKQFDDASDCNDPSICVTVPVGKYLFGLLGDEWPPNTVNPLEELAATRLVALEIDGITIPVSQSDIVASVSPKSGGFAIYNVFPRFNTPGAHTLKYIWNQRKMFFFVYPYDVIGIPDPFPQYEGRRVFVQEADGDMPLDGQMVLSYSLTVVP